MQIKKAQRKSVNIKIAVTGPSGAGKTMSSLMLAHGLAPSGRILVIDTEDGSSNLYADHGNLKGLEFDVLQIEAPYTVPKYLKALELGVEGKYDVIIIDSLSHAWAGEGGLLEKKSAIDSRGGNSYTNWATVTKEHELLKSKVVHCPTHIIVTMRSKQDYIVESNEKGKQAPKKVGLAPIQREGMEYEFTTVFDVGMDHQFNVSKDRTGCFDGRIEHITIKTGAEIRAWLEGGAKFTAQELNDIAMNDSFVDILEKFCLGDEYNSANDMYASWDQETKKKVWSKLSREFKDWFKDNMLKSNKG
jgi:hypothetical protein